MAAHTGRSLSFVRNDQRVNAARGRLGPLGPDGLRGVYNVS